MFTPSTRHLIVDDERTLAPVGDVIHARTSGEALQLLAVHTFDWVWLDHDLGGADTTRPIATMLEELAATGQDRPVRRVAVHTANPVGRRWLAAAVRHYQPIIVNAADWAA